MEALAATLPSPTMSTSLFRFIDTINEPLSWSIDVFCRLVLSEMQDLQGLRVTEIRHYKEKDGLEHEFLIVGIKHGEKQHMLRIERSTPARVRRTFLQRLKQTSSSVLPALDTVSISSSFKKLTANMNRGPIIHVATLPISSSVVTLHDFCLLLSLFPSFSPTYKLKEEQCYWFCNVILATISSLGDLSLTHGEGFKKAGKYGKLSINMSAKACQLFIDGYKIVRRLQHNPDEPGQIELTPDIARTLVAMLTVQTDEAKAQALMTITSLASSSSDGQQLLLNARCTDQFRLIFVSSSAKLKALIFLALDALGLPDVFPGIDLAYDWTITTLGDSFTEEDRHALQLQYAKSLRDVIDLCGDSRPTIHARSAAIYSRHANHHLFISDTIPHMAESKSSEVRLVCAMAISALAQYSPPLENIIQQFTTLLNDPSRDVRIASITGLRKFVDAVQYRKLCLTTFPLVAFLILANSDYIASKIEELHSAGSVESAETAMVNELSFRTLDDLDEVGLMAVSAAATYPVCYPIITDTWPQIVQFLTNKSWRLRLLTVNILSDLLPISEFQLLVEKAIPKVLDLLADDQNDIRQSAVGFLTKAASKPNYHSVMLWFFSRIVELLADESWGRRQTATDLLSGLVTTTEFQLRVEETIPNVFDLLRDDHNDVQRSAVEFLKKASSESRYYPVILELFPRLVQLLADESWGRRQVATDLLSSLVTTTEFQLQVEGVIPKVFDLLRDHYSHVRRSSVEFLTKAASESSYHSVILELFPRIVELLADESWERRQTATDLLSGLVTMSEFQLHVEIAIQKIFDLLKDSRSDIRQSAGGFLIKAASEPSYHSVMLALIPRIVGLFAEQSWQTRQAAVDMLSCLVATTEFQPHAEEAIPKVFDLLRDGDFDVRRSALRYMTKAASECNLHPIILGLFPQVVDLLTDKSWTGRKSAVILLSSLARNDEFRPRVEEVFPQVLCLLNDSHQLVQREAIAFEREILP